ncbi:MAG TPA: recombination protein RecR [Firmicutes bacterium]|nr:recombination protein RecR [Bacillota bacterium]
MDVIYPRGILGQLVKEISKFPGVGLRSAERIAYSIILSGPSRINEFSALLNKAKSALSRCKLCGDISEGEICQICRDEKRDRTKICVVREPLAILSIERSGEYRGLYHSLDGLISPLDGIKPEDLRIGELMKRIDDNIEEVIIALDPSVEGDATSMYLADLIKKRDVTVTRLAYGLPVGSDIEYADATTIRRALQGRQEL